MGPVCESGDFLGHQRQLFFPTRHENTQSTSKCIAEYSDLEKERSEESKVVEQCNDTKKEDNDKRKVAEQCKDTNKEQNDQREVDENNCASKEGQYIAVWDVGAYCSAMGSVYNMRTRPMEVLLSGKTWRVIRKRETFEDLLALYDIDSNDGF